MTFCLHSIKKAIITHYQFINRDRRVFKGVSVRESAKFGNVSEFRNPTVAHLQHLMIDIFSLNNLDSECLHGRVILHFYL